MNTPLIIDEFIKLSQSLPVVDVRSPGEFMHGHIPGAHSIPLFDNSERAEIGTIYKQIGKKEAVDKGYELVEPKLKSFFSEVKNKTGVEPQKEILVHCWRGGMRSTYFANLLNSYGYKTYTLIKGYKAYRTFVLNSFKNNFRLLVIGGETGSGKTEILNNLPKHGQQIIDLEKMANHKGSAFGALGENPQPTQEQFENNLFRSFSRIDSAKPVWIEDESRNIGRCQLPPALWEQMKTAPILRINMPKELRIKRLITDYGKFPKDEFITCLKKIEQRMGGQHLKHALEEYENDNLEEAFGTILVYYDRTYNYNHELRKMKDVFFVDSNTINAASNAATLLKFAITKFQFENVGTN